MKKRTVALYIVMGVVSFILLWACDSGKTTGPDGNSNMSVSVVVYDEFGRPVAGGKLTTNPYSGEIVTDSEGRAVIDNLSTGNYTVYLRRPNFPVYTKVITVTSTATEDIVFTIPTESPIATIDFPSTNDYVSVHNILFSGTGFDPENGSLPDSLLTWTSNRDGVLGHGKDLSLETMSFGQHVIELTATDLDGKKDHTSIIVDIIDYNPNSYFPIFPNAEWNYEHLTFKFTIANTSGVTESWVLNNIDAIIDKNNVRTTSISYQVQVSTGKREFRYIIEDHLSTIDNRIIVDKTVENIKIWRDNPYGTPLNELTIVTTYSPEYVLIPNDLDVGAAGTSTTRNNLSVKWSYLDPYYGNREFIESFHIDTVTTIEPEEIVTISNTDIAAIPMTVTQSNSVRKWWLAKGIGIVKMTYNTFFITTTSTYPTAVLISTNLAGLAGKRPQSSKEAFFTPEGFSVPINTVPIPAEEGFERTRALRDLLSGMIPR